MLDANQVGAMARGHVLCQAKDMIQIDEEAEHEKSERLIPVQRKETDEEQADQEVGDG